jgi:hypothetical protein
MGLARFARARTASLGRSMINFEIDKRASQLPAAYEQLPDYFIRLP